MTNYPNVFRVLQHFDNPQLHDIPGEVELQLSRLSLGETIGPGETVAITAGSRGIANIQYVIRAIVEHLKRLGANPFIVPAMGSHGGGTAEGQQKLIESYGITESFCRCPIRTDMSTVIICNSAEGFPVHFDAHAHSADHVIVCNRVKPHSLFTGDHESGLMKMMLIGLGKNNGARIYHKAIKDYGFDQILQSVAGKVLTNCSIVAGIAIIEGPYGQTAKIEAIVPNDFESREKYLLTQAKQLMPRLPFTTADILLVDEIGKNISGSGLDVNVVGRKYLIHQAAENEYPKIRMIAVRDLSRLTHGSAMGIGLVEFCRKRVLDKMDVNATRVNALTGGYFFEAMLPLDYDTDSDMMHVMLSQVGLVKPLDARMMWIRNTVTVAEVECSTAYFEEAKRRDDLEIISDLRPLPFDATRNLSDEHMNPATLSDADDQH